MEDFHTLKQVITKGLRDGYMSINADFSAINMINGKWVLPDGIEIGSTWDIILNPRFANIFWKENFEQHLVKMVVMNSEDRIEYLQQFVEEESVVVDESEVAKFSADDSLMETVKFALQRLESYSKGVYVDSCNHSYKKLKPIIEKDSVTELSENDFLIMNSSDRTMGANFSTYLNNMGKYSFTICPECGFDNFTHVEGCSIVRKSGDYLINQNDGC